MRAAPYTVPRGPAFCFSLTQWLHPLLSAPNDPRHVPGPPAANMTKQMNPIEEIALDAQQTPVYLSAGPQGPGPKRSLCTIQSIWSQKRQR